MQSGGEQRGSLLHKACFGVGDGEADDQVIRERSGRLIGREQRDGFTVLATSEKVTGKPLQGEGGMWVLREGEPPLGFSLVAMTGVVEGIRQREVRLERCRVEPQSLLQLRDGAFGIARRGEA